MHHFFVKPGDIKDSEVTFDVEDRRHMQKVLRLQPGEIVSASDGKNFYCISLEGFGENIQGRIVSASPATSESPLHTVLVQGIAKGEKMDFIVQKATELGVSQIIPLHSEYCVVKLDAKKAAEKSSRWQKIAIEAAKQSKRAVAPVVREPVNWQKLFSLLPEHSLKLVLWEDEKNLGLGQILAEHSNAESIVIFIGPEGGFSQSEVNNAKAQGAISVSLGKRILRTETAGLATLAVIQYSLGDMGGRQHGE